MKTRLLLALLTPFVSASVAACGQVETVPNQDPPVASPTPETNNGPKDPAVPAKPAKARNERSDHAVHQRRRDRDPVR